MGLSLRHDIAELLDDRYGVDKHSHGERPDTIDKIIAMVRLYPQVPHPAAEFSVPDGINKKTKE